MATQTTETRVDASSDEGRLRPIQKRVFAIAALIALLDGFDTQVIAYVGPVIARDWSLSPQQLGPIFGAGMIGLAFGAAIFGPLADRIGRKAVIMIATCWFGLATLLTALTDDVGSLMLLRFLTGLGLGGAIPNIIAITAEFAPAHIRGRIITLMFCGFPLGALMGGLLSMAVLPHANWQMLFVCGGVLPLLLAVSLPRALPESLGFLLERRPHDPRIAKIASALGTLPPRRSSASDSDRVGVVELFREGRWSGTLLLWCCFFMSLLVLYLLVNWLPTLLSRADFGLRTSILSTVLLNLGGIVGGIILATLVDRLRGALLVSAAFALAGAAMLGLAFGGSHSGLILALAGIAGLGIGGAQLALNAIAAACYPTRIRSTGVGWAFGIGRIGAIVGPLAGGILLQANIEQAELFALSSIPAFIAATAVALLGRAKTG